MALTKETRVGKVEVVGDFNAVQVRTDTFYVDDGVADEDSASYSRHVVSAGDDYNNEDPKVQAICAAVHTPEVIAAYQAMLAAQEAEMNPGE